MLVGKDLEVEKIIVRYIDGTERVITKGAAITLTIDNNENVQMDFDFIEFTQQELIAFVWGVIRFGAETGILTDAIGEDEDDDD